MNETPSTPEAGAAAPERSVRMSSAPSAPPAASAPSLMWLWIAVVLAGLIGVVAIGLVWQTLLREHNLEQELVRRQQAQQAQATEAQMLAKQAQDSAR